MKRPFVFGSIVFGMVVAVVAIIAVVAFQRPSAQSPTATGEDPPVGLESFYTQAVAWEECDESQCAEIDVPVDYDDPSGETATIAVKRIPATGAGGRSMFVNPGGPGGSAVEYADYLAGVLPEQIRQMYDVVGVDPRGVGQSSPLECLDGARFDEFVAADPAPDTPEEIQAMRDGIIEMGRACEANSGQLASHVSTAEAARDHDIVRALVGAESFDWFGASYGTQLGATYADFFPERVGRMVLDAAVDPSLDATEQSFGQTTGFQRALESYAESCAASGCALGADKDAVLQTVQTVVDRLETDPIPTADGRLLTTGIAFYGIAFPLYSESLWDYLTMALQSVLLDDPEVLLALSDYYFDRGSDGEFADNSGQVIYAVNCLDSPTNATLDEVQAELPRFEQASPIFGPGLAWGVMGCSDWPLESASPQEAVQANGAAPIIVIGTTRDPATPYEWSQSLADQLESGVLISRDGDGHTAYNQGSACIDDAVNAFFIDGTLPEDGLMCET